VSIPPRPLPHLSSLVAPCRHPRHQMLFAPCLFPWPPRLFLFCILESHRWRPPLLVTCSLFFLAFFFLLTPFYTADPTSGQTRANFPTTFPLYFHSSGRFKGRVPVSFILPHPVCCFLWFTSCQGWRLCGVLSSFSFCSLVFFFEE